MSKLYTYKQRVIEYTFKLCENTEPIQTAVQVFNALKKDFSPVQESLHVILLNTQNRIQSIEVVKGGTNSLMVSPKDIFMHIIKNNSPHFILAHNHPSTMLNPSNEDLVLTKKILEGSKLLGLYMLDHIIYSSEDYYSIKQNTKVFD